MHGCLRLILGIAGFWLLGALTTWILPLGDQPGSAGERTYHRNAHEMRSYINNHPVAVLLTRLLIVRTTISDLRWVPNSCDCGSDSTVPDYRNVVATVTDYTIWAIPVQRYGTTCAGMMIGRGRPGYQPLLKAEEPPVGAPATRSPPVPPPPQ